MMICRSLCFTDGEMLISVDTRELTESREYSDQDSLHLPCHEQCLGTVRCQGQEETWRILDSIVPWATPDIIVVSFLTNHPSSWPQWITTAL